MSSVTSIKAKRSKPINVDSGDLHTVVDECEKVLAQHNCYSMGGSIAVVLRNEKDGSIVCANANAPVLTYMLSKFGRFERTKADGQKVKVDPPGRHVAALAGLLEHRYLPVLYNVASQPYLRSDGSICKTSGYDESTGIYCEFNQDNFPIPESPSKADAAQALMRLSDLLEGFEFRESCDKSAAIAALLTASTRVSFPTAPLYLVTAFLPGSGKSYLCEITTIVASDREPTILTFSSSPDEFEKRQIAALIAAPSFMLYDNLTCDVLAHPSLCTALTSPAITGRKLGESKTVTPSTRVMMAANGNNVAAVDDSARRTFISRLEPSRDDPQNRRFQSDPKALLKKHRGKYVADCLTIMSAYIAADKPSVDVPPVAGFDAWATHCRNPLVWLGMSDPCQTMIASSRDNPRQRLSSAIIDSLHEHFQARPFTVRKILDEANAELNDLLLDAASDDGKEVNKQKLGHWLRNKVGHSGTDARLVSFESKRVASWLIESTANDADVYQSQSRAG